VGIEDPVDLCADLAAALDRAAAAVSATPVKPVVPSA
jgi:hypothetical protein